MEFSHTSQQSNKIEELNTVGHENEIEQADVREVAANDDFGDFGDFNEDTQDDGFGDFTKDTQDDGFGDFDSSPVAVAPSIPSFETPVADLQEEVKISPFVTDWLI